jgi:hypothetical protein
VNIICIIIIVSIYAYSINKSTKTDDALHEIKEIIENSVLRYIQLLTSTIWYILGLLYAYYMYHEFSTVKYIQSITILYLIIYTIAFIGTILNTTSAKNVNHTNYLIFVICSFLAMLIPYVIDLLANKCVLYERNINIEMQPITTKIQQKKTKMRTRKTNLSSFNPRLNKNTPFLSVRNVIRQSTKKPIPSTRKSPRIAQINPMYKM